MIGNAWLAFVEWQFQHRRIVYVFMTAYLCCLLAYVITSHFMFDERPWFQDYVILGGLALSALLSWAEFWREHREGFELLKK